MLRVLEIMLYVLLDLGPNLILALLPFRDLLRFSGKVTVLAGMFLYFFIVISRIFSSIHPSYAGLLTVLWIILYLGFYIIFIHAGIFKQLFVLLTILNYGSFTTIVYNYFSCHCFPQASERPYSVYASAVLVIVYGISYPFIYQLINKTIRPLITFPENNRHWRYLWPVPATFCLSYYYNLYANGGVTAFSMNLSNMLFAVFFNLGALFVTYLMMHLLKESNLSLSLKAEIYQLNMQSLQYEHLKNRIDDAKRAKHDLKQNLAVMQTYIQNNDKEALLNYMRSYISSLPSDSPIVYCENNAINALIVYYADLAEKHGISFEAKVQYPEAAAIPDTDAVVLIGNLLGNALEACLRQSEGTPFLSLHIKPLQKMLVITLDNSYSGSIRREGELFLSSKPHHIGMGISSAKKIAEKYNGILQLNYEEGQFHASATLHL